MLLFFTREFIITVTGYISSVTDGSHIGYYGGADERRADRLGNQRIDEYVMCSGVFSCCLYERAY